MAVPSFYDALAEIIPQIDRGSNSETYPKLEPENVAKVSDLLKSSGDEDGSKRPRTCILLYQLSLTQYHDSFSGYPDDCLPYMDWSLPDGLQDSEACNYFLKHQHLVLTQDLESRTPPMRSHVELKSKEDCHLTAIKSLGFGGCGFVECVRGEYSQKKYARKSFRLRGNRSQRQSKQRSFKNELDALKDLSHHHLTQYIGSYEYPSGMAFMMLPIADCDLSSWLEMHLGDSRTKQFFGCLASAVAYVHQENVRHKDIKLTNVLMYQGVIYLSDFGSFRKWKDPDHSITTGRPDTYTARYATPEVLDEENRGRSADIFSLGCVFLEMATSLSGRPIHDLSQHLDENGTKKSRFSENEAAVLSWIEEIKRCQMLQTGPELLGKIASMLDAEKEKRPKASDFAGAIVDMGEESSCRQCYVDGIVRKLESINIHVRDPSHRATALCEAAKQGNTTAFGLLLKTTEDLGARADVNNRKGTALEIAIELSHLEIAKSYLSHFQAKGWSLDIRLALCHAATQGFESGVDLLLEFEADPNDPHPTWRSPFYMAVSRGHEQIVHKMINHGVNLDHKETLDGKTPIHAAVRNPASASVLEAILAQKPNINAAGFSGETSLLEAVRRTDSLGFVMPLLNAGADPNIPDNKGEIPLNRAVKNGDIETVRVLLSAGADSSRWDNEGQPAACIAASAGATAILQTILKSSGLKPHRNKQGESALHLAVMEKHESTVEMLLRETPSDTLHPGGKYKRTPLHYAVQANSATIIQMMLTRRHAPTCVRDSRGYTPLRISMMGNSDVEVMRLLIDRDPKAIELESNSSCTPLGYACIADSRQDLARVLIEKGASIDSVANVLGSRPLHITSYFGSVKIAQLLLNAGANINKKNDEGDTPLRVAAWMEQLQIVELLLERGASTTEKNDEG